MMNELRKQGIDPNMINEYGDVDWEDNVDDVDTPSGRDWNPNDEILYCSILMWGELEQTIG